MEAALLLCACTGLLLPSGHPVDARTQLSATHVSTSTRRAFLHSALVVASGASALVAAADAPVMPTFDADGSILVANGYSDETSFQTVTAGAASVRMLGR